MSLKKILLIGLLLGVGFSAWNWIATLLNPFAEDSLDALAIFYGPMFTLWGIAGFVAAHRTGRNQSCLRWGLARRRRSLLFSTLCFCVRCLTRKPNGWRWSPRRYGANGSKCALPLTLISFPGATKTPSSSRLPRGLEALSAWWA